MKGKLAGAILMWEKCRHNVTSIDRILRYYRDNEVDGHLYNSIHNTIRVYVYILEVNI